LTEVRSATRRPCSESIGETRQHRALERVDVTDPEDVVPISVTRGEVEEMAIIGTFAFWQMGAASRELADAFAPMIARPCRAR
jgi:hypothetical protein